MPAVILSDAQTNVILSFEGINLVVSIFFLVVFSSRYRYLQSFSMTNKYKNFFPRLRIILSVVYILISLATLIFSLATRLYPDWYNYLMIGGGGACINSIVLVLELLVLRLQLLKEYPYTRYHIGFFTVLALVSILRYILICLINDFTPDCIVNLVLSALLMLTSIVQFTYWVIKRQSLPQFITYIEVNLDQLKNNELRQDFISDRIKHKSYSSATFPFLIPTVSVENGLIKIVLEVLAGSSNNNGNSGTVWSKKESALGTLLESLQRRESEMVCSELYTLDQLQKCYIQWGRFPLKKQMDFDKLQLQQLTKQLQQLLQQLLLQKRWYQPEVLKLLRLPPSYYKLYQQMLQQEETPQQNDYDKYIGIKLPEDKNAIFCSIHLFKHLWVSTHYEFYIKAAMTSNHTAYPIKRYSEFQELHLCLRNLIRTLGKSLELPPLPKKHLFHWNQDEHISRRKLALQKYIKRLSNDYTLMEVPQIRAKILIFLGIRAQLQLQPRFQQIFYNGLKIEIGEMTKIFVKDEYVTYYEFILNQKQGEVSRITKRYSQFQELHMELERWMKNIRTKYNFIEMPEKVYFKSESLRHQKLKSYLENVSEARDIGKVYAVNSFFNIYGNEGIALDEISAIEVLTRSKKSVNETIFNDMIELQQNVGRRNSSESSGRFSRILDDLGNENYD